MYNKTTRKIATLVLTAVMTCSLGLNACLSGRDDDTQQASVTASAANSGITFKDVTDSGLNASALFTENYNPDVVKINEIGYDEERVAIVNLDSETLLDYADEAGMSYGAYLETAEAASAQAQIQKQINSFLTQVKRAGISAQVVYTYNTVTTGVALKATGSDLNLIAAMDGVDSVVLSEHYDTPQVIEISNDTNVYTTGIYNTSEVDPELRGEGMVIAVVDTGMDVQHEVFSEDSFKAETYTLTKEKVTEKLSQLKATELSSSATAETLYKSSKLPYAFDYADKDTNVYPSYSSHGVHVSGIIAGNYTEISQATVESDDDLTFEYDYENQTYYFEGVVPDAQIVTLKVFTDNIDAEGLGGADTEDILAALEDAVTLEVDVINMSLGSSGGFSSYADSYMEYVYDRIENAGISLVVAAGNEYSSGYGGVNGTNLTSNPDSATVGSPSTYSAAISVASINGQRDPYMLANASSDSETMVFFTEASDGNSNKMDFIGDIFEKLKSEEYDYYMDEDSDSIQLQYVVIPGLGRSYNYSETIKEKLNSQPSIALVARGTTTFEEKMKIAKENGAIGIIIYNNVAGSISMTMGAKDDSDIIPSCSVSMDIGNQLVLGAVNSVGTIILDKSYLSGPFMSDFSSWGPSPSLELKPEITAYGGNVTSSVAGGYDVYSGTSMAAPNMAGAVAIIRQSLKKKYPDWTAKQIHDRTYQIMMSTAGIILDQTGNPYSPRKQGSGIADIDASLNTQSYIYVKDGDSVLSKTKIELYDDPQRTGVYSFTFYVENTSDAYALYNITPYVMTETVSSDGKTVAEKSKLLTEANVQITVNGVTGTRVSLAGGSTATVSVVITLSDSEKKYLDENFENGMYVEGFISLTQTASDSGDFYDLSIPFLAFYGDWTDAPMLDYSIYEIAENEADDSIPDDDKIKIDFWATTPYSRYGDEYILPMGEYLYTMSDDMDPIYASEDKAAISMYNETNHATSYQFYAVYAGLLRGMAVCYAKIVNEYTGEVVWEDTLTNIAKGYANGGSTRPGFVEIEFNPYEMNLPGNTKFHFYMEGYLEYGDGTQGHNNSFDFTFYTDYEAPSLVGAALRYEEYLDSNEDTQTRIYLDLTTYDNHYAQAILLCYVDDDYYLELLQNYITPVYSDSRGQTVTTSIEITDYYEDFFDNMSVQLVDYAMNYSIYTLDLSSAITFPEKISFDEEQLEVTAGSVTSLAYTVTPATAQHYDLLWESSDESVVRVEKGEIYAVAAGEAYVTVYASISTTFEVPSAKIKVVVTESTTASTAKYKSLSFGLIMNSNDVPVNPTNTTVDVHPNEYIQLVTISEPWYLPQMEVTWSTQNSLVATVDENGLVHTLKEGVVIITAQQKNGLFSVAVTLNVGPEFVISSSYVLTGYYGTGGDVVVPEELNFMYIDEECFMGNTTITSFIVPEDVLQIYEKAFYGCTSLKYIKFPKSLTLVGDSAFEGCTALETIDMTDSASVIFSHRTFYGCTKLTEIINDARLTAIWDYTFAGCSSLKTLDLSNLVQVGKYSFANCTSLESITTSRYTEIGEGMFFGCVKLNNLVLAVEYVGKNAFYACSGITNLTLTGKCVIDEGAFRECSSLNMLYFAGEVYDIGERAFEGCRELRVLVLPNNAVTIGQDAFSGCTNLSTLGLQPETLMNPPEAFRNCGSWTSIMAVGITLTDSGYQFDLTGLTADDIENYYFETGGNVLYSKDKTQLIAVPVKATEINLENIEVIGDGAFYGLTDLVKVTIPDSVKEIGDYAFAYSGIESIVIPASVEKLGIGAFAYCYSLSEVVFAEDGKITEIPEGCFNTTYKLKSIALPASVVSIGDYAFGESAINTLNVIGGSEDTGVFNGEGLSVAVIGDNAFALTMFVNVYLPETLTNLGDYAFAVSPNLEEVTFLSDVKMGAFTFIDCAHLEKVTFYDEMTDIGTYTFVSMAGNPSLSEVILPASLSQIGDYVFWGCLALDKLGTTLNGEVEYGVLPSGVTVIGEYAFYGCSALGSLDLSNVVYIGDSAFAGSLLDKADLENAEYIGAYAFYQSGIESVNIPKAVVIGDGTLAYTNITVLDLPSTLKTLGNGAFHYNFYLTGIYIEDNDYFFIDPIDGKYGVLYSVLPSGGYQVEAFPGGNALREYTVLNGTTRIGEMAFTGSNILQSITLPVTLETIGDKGFYDCNASTYTFLGVNAPNLEARYVDGDSGSTEEWSSSYISPYEIFARNGSYADERFYANFYYYAMFSLYNSYDFGLTLIYPENGDGYDGQIWTYFFSTTALGEETIDNTTLAAVNAIKSIDIEKIAELIAASASDETAYKEALELTELLKTAYAAYSNVTLQSQKTFLEGGYDGVNYVEILNAALADMREVKDKFGIPTNIVSIKITHAPDKLTYVYGEDIDFTGLIVTATYDDGTTGVITDYEIDRTTANTLGNNVRINITAEGKSTYFYVKITEAEGVEEQPIIDPNPEEESTFDPIYVWLPIVCVAGAAAVAGSVVFVIKKRKSS